MSVLLAVVGVVLVVLGLLWRSREIARTSAGGSSAVSARGRQDKPSRLSASTPGWQARRAAAAAKGSGSLPATASSGMAEAVRRSDRILFKIPLEVSGSDFEGNPFTERAQTEVINRNGAAVILRNSIVPGSQLTVKNLQTGQSCKFRVRSRMHDLPGGLREWGVECMDPAPNFWGISFADSPQQPENEAFGSLLECTGCHCREMTKVGVSDYRTMVKENFSMRHCVWCGKETQWNFAVVVADLGSTTSPGLKAPEVTMPKDSGVERRREERRIAQMPISMRHEDGREEFTMTENVSRSGVCCAADMKLVVGENIFLSLVSDHGPGEAEFRAEVRWCRKISDKRSLYGMKMERAQPSTA